MKKIISLFASMFLAGSAHALYLCADGENVVTKSRTACAPPYRDLTSAEARHFLLEEREIAAGRAVVGHIRKDGKLSYDNSSAAYAVSVRGRLGR